MGFFKKKEINQKQQDNYNRVYQLHQDAFFLYYIDDAYLEPYDGGKFMKLEGVVAKGTAKPTDTLILYNCNGRKKASITAEEFYVGQSKVELLEGGDKKVAIYPKEQDVDYIAGDMLCIMKENTL